MSDASHRKSGAATRPSPDKEALRMPLGRQGKDAGGEGPEKGCRAQQTRHCVCAALPPHPTFAGC